MTAVYGCHNRREHVASYPLADGHFMDGVTRTPRMVSQPTTGAKACQFTLSALGAVDSRCSGCKHKSTETKA